MCTKTEASAQILLCKKEHLTPHPRQLQAKTRATPVLAKPLCKGYGPFLDQ